MNLTFNFDFKGFKTSLSGCLCNLFYPNKKHNGCLTFLLHSSVFRREGAWLAWSTSCLHGAVARHKLIYLFDYCPASWQALVIDGHCVPAAARLLVSPAQNSLKDSSAGTPVTLLHFFSSSSLYHSLSPSPSPPSINFWHYFIAAKWSNFSCPPLFFFIFSPLVVDLQMQIGQVTFASLI